MRTPTTRPAAWALALALWLGSSGCASLLEKPNRFVFGFNDVVDCAVLRPASHIYSGVVPERLRRGISNFFDNLADLDVILNDFLQGKGGQGVDDTKRFVVNSTLGVGGLFDVAVRMGLEEHEEDFGQTLGVWGAGPGPYLVLPILGPSSLRDVWMWPMSTLTNPFTYVSDARLVTSGRVALTLTERSEAQDQIDRRDRLAVDRYVFTKEAYLQRRAFLVSDGEIPTEDVDQDFESLLDELDEN